MKISLSRADCHWHISFYLTRRSMRISGPGRNISHRSVQICTQRAGRPISIVAPSLRQKICSRSGTCVVQCNAESTKKFTPSGIAVDGLSPTSPKAWAKISTLLRNSKVRTLSVDDVAQVSSGKDSSVIVDVRPAGEYAAGHIPGSVNVEFYRLIEGWDVVKAARRALFAFFGVLNGTEYNDRFLSEFEAAVPAKDKSVVLVCTIGGTLEPTGPSEFGRQSRSLTAAFELINAGWTKVSFLDGGVLAWKKEGMDLEVLEE